MTCSGSDRGDCARGQGCGHKPADGEHTSISGQLVTADCTVSALPVCVLVCAGVWMLVKGRSAGHAAALTVGTVHVCRFLNDNQLTGSIPAALGNVSQLIYL